MDSLTMQTFIFMDKSTSLDIYLTTIKRTVSVGRDPKNSILLKLPSCCRVATDFLCLLSRCTEGLSGTCKFGISWSQK